MFPNAQPKSPQGAKLTGALEPRTAGDAKSGEASQLLLN